MQATLDFSAPVTISMKQITYGNIGNLFDKLKEHEDLMSHLDEVGHPTVLKAEFKFVDDSLCASVQVFKMGPCPETSLLSPDRRVDVCKDWFDKSHLWFRRAPNGYEAFIEYIDEYQDPFTLDSKAPTMVLNLKVG